MFSRTHTNTNSKQHPFGYTPEFRRVAAHYYDVDAVIAFLNTPVSYGHSRYRCSLCGWALDIPDSNVHLAPEITCAGCGGCGTKSLSPIEKWR